MNLGLHLLHGMSARTSRMVSVCDIICMLTCDWLVGKLSDERERTSLRPDITCFDLSVISVFMNTLDMYWELEDEVETRHVNWTKVMERAFVH